MFRLSLSSALVKYHSFAISSSLEHASLGHVPRAPSLFTNLRRRQDIRMCGISCIVALQKSAPPTSSHKRTFSGGEKVQTNGVHSRTSLSEELDRSLETIKHRGPDSRGQWLSSDGRIGPLKQYGFRVLRLSTNIVL